jgi:hypothetical protein
MVFGPNWRLAQGRYRLTVTLDTTRVRRKDLPVMGIEVIAQARFQLVWRDVAVAELMDGAVSLVFEVPAELASDGGRDAPFEFRIWNLHNADLVVRDLRLDVTREEVTPSRWRLLGRSLPLFVPPIFSRGRAKLLLHPLSGAGLALAPTLPRLRLPAGRFRLEIAGQAWAPGKRPALRVGLHTRDGAELVGQEFLAADIAAGRAGFAFEVPEEYAIEGGENAWFTLSLRPSRRAVLALSSIDLRPLRPDEDVPLAAPALGAARGRAVIVGNCQAGLVADAFHRDDDLARKYRLRHHYMELQPNLHAQGLRELAACDVLLVQDIREWADYPLRDAVPASVPVIFFPCLRFSSPWPFDAFNGPDDKLARLRDYPNYEFTYFDGLLGRLRQQIPDPAARFEAYRSLDIPGVIDCRRLHRIEEQRLVKMDEKFGFGIGAHVLENFRRRPVFHTIGHPHGELMAMLLQHIAGALGLAARARRRPSLNNLDNLQIPVHPAVAEKLEMRWANASTTYAYRGERVTWETYVRRYIAHYG